MKSINQCMQLIKYLKESRSLNHNKVNFVSINWTTCKVTYEYDNPDEYDSDVINEVDLWIWLSWHMWRYRGTIDALNKLLNFSDAVNVVTSDSKLHKMMYFGDGIFSIIRSEDTSDWKSRDLSKFNSETYYVADLLKVDELIILPNDNK